MIKPTTRMSLARLVTTIHTEADNADDLRDIIQIYQREAKKLQDKLVNLPTKEEQPKKTIAYNGGYRIA